MTRTIPAPVARSNGTTTKPPVKQWTTTHGHTRKADRILIYGPGGAGKTTLAAGAPGVVFADLEAGSADMDIQRVSGVESWSDLRSWLQSDSFAGVRSICIDSATRAQEWCERHVIATVAHEKGKTIESIEDYGFGKGAVFAWEEWRRLLADLDQHYQAGRNVILIAHDQDAKAPNPDGDDFLRHQPRMQNSEKASIMRATVEWCDHVLYIAFDKAVADGKAKGSGSRSIHGAGTPTMIAKTRGIDLDRINFEKGSNSLWDHLLARTPAADACPV